MNSCIYEGTIRHRRFTPVRNQFRYRLFFMYLDLAELDTVFDCHPLWSVNRPNIAEFRRADHLGDPEMPLEKAVREHIRKETGAAPAGPIRLLTHLRYLGHCFNPVSFYYCYDSADATVESIVAEIHNTPWGEEHPYVLNMALNEHPLTEWRRFRFPKGFHVSPFMDMDVDYDWRFRVPGARINVHMILNQKGRRLFDATLDLERRVLTSQALTRAMLVYPALTMKVIFLIYWQAFRLRLKGAPFYTHPQKRISYRP